MKRIFTLLTFFIGILSVCTLSVTEGYAQLTGDNYPVQAHVYVQRPSLKMPEYFSSSTMLRTDLILKDLTKTTLDVYLGWQITGLGLAVEAGTLPGFVPPNYLTLTKGSKRQLSGAELRKYFQPGMLAVSGVSENVIFNGKLPEGFYTIKITAYEAGTGRQVSNTAETFFSVAYALPPVINLPLIGSEQPVTRPQSVLLQWMPRHTATGSNRITYSGKVCEVAEDEDPNIAINGSQNCFTIPAQPGTSYVLKASDLPLKVGKRYAFQVQVTDNNEQLEFQNQGYSEVSWFRFGEACKPPSGLQVNAIAAGRLNVSWNANPQATGYKLLYRSKSQAEWTEQTTLGTSVSLVSLNPELDYEFKVITVCEIGNESPESETVTWEGEGEVDEELEDLIKKVLNPEGEPIVSTGPGIERAAPSDPLPETFEDLIPKDPTKIPCISQLHSYEECSDQHPEGHISTADKDLRTLKVGDLITIYDYLVVLTEVSGGNNIFSGKGLVKMPFLEDKKMPVEFSNVEIKQDKADQNGGCVMAVNGYFRVRTGLTPEQIKQEEIDLIHTVRTNTDPGSIYISRGQVITELGEELTTTGKDLCDGKPITDEAKQNLLEKHTLTKQGLQDWAEDAADLYSELDLDGTEILSSIQALITALEANIAIINSGEGCPENPDIKAEMENITKKIKEDLNGNPEKELSDSPVISNVEVKNITSSTATISWKGDKRFTHYIVTYQKPGEGIVTKVVGKESALSLSGLENGSFYYFSIKGINEDGSEFVVPERIFSTPDNDFPKPKNIVPENLDETTVKLTWDKELMHKSYKLTYTDTKGEQKFAYPTTNQIVLNDIHPDTKYAFELTGIGSQNQTASEYGDFGLVYCNIMIDNNTNVAYYGEEVELEASCVNGDISWNIPGWVNTKGHIFIVPITRSILKTTLRETTVFTAVCKVENADGIRYCTAETEIKVYPQECKDFKILSEKSAYKLGQIITLSTEGCDGEVYWPKINISGSTAEFAFLEAGSYYAECLGEGNKCEAKITLERECYIPISIEKRKRDTAWFSNNEEVQVKIRVDFGRVIESKVISGKCTWDLNTDKPSSEYIGKATKFDTDNVTILIEVRYYDGSICQEVFELSSPTRSCSDKGFSISKRGIGEFSFSSSGSAYNTKPKYSQYYKQIEFKTYGDKCDGDIEWTIGGNKITSNVGIIVNYNELPARITAKCLKNNCETFIDGYQNREPNWYSGNEYWQSSCALYIEEFKYATLESYYSKVFNNLTPVPSLIYENGDIIIPTLPSDAFVPNYVRIGFRTGNDYASSFYVDNSDYIPGNSRYFTIIVRDEPVKLLHRCHGSSRQYTFYPPNSLPEGQKCIEIITPKKTVSLGEQVNLEVKGCIDGIKWFKNGNEVNVITRIFSDLPDQVGEEAYSVSCEFPECSADVKIKVNPCSLKVSTNKKEIKPFEITTLKSEGCTGQVEWSDEFGILSISEGEKTVTPAKSTTYYAKCLNRPLCRAEIEIKVKTIIPPEPECEDFVITVAENPAQECKELTLNSTGCKQGMITWSVGNQTIVKGENIEVKFSSTGSTTVINASCKRPDFPSIESTLEVPTQLCLEASASPSEIRVNQQSTVTLSHKNCTGTVIWRNTKTGELEPFSSGSSSKTITLNAPRGYEVTCERTGYITKKQIVNITNRISPQDPSAYNDSNSSCSKKGFGEIELCDNNSCSKIDYRFTPSIQIEHGKPNNRYSVKVRAHGCTNAVWEWSSVAGNETSTSNIFQFYPNDQGWITLNCDGCISGRAIYVNIYNPQNSGGSSGQTLFNCNSYKNTANIYGKNENGTPVFANNNHCPAFRGTEWYDRDPSQYLDAINLGYGETYIPPSSGSTERWLYSVCEVNGKKCVAQVEMEYWSPYGQIQDKAVSLNLAQSQLTQDALLQVSSSSVTTPCDPNTPVPLKSLMAQYVSHLICEYIYALANQEGEFVESRAREFYASLKKNLAATYPQYTANFVFDKTESEVVELLRQAYQNVKSGAGHNCAEGEEIVSGFTGNITYGDYQNVRQKYDDVTDEMADDLTPNDIRITTETNPPSCGLPEGSITITASGGTEPYSYSIDGGVTFTLNKTLFYGLSVGTYNVVVKDINGNTRATSEIVFKDIEKISPIESIITTAVAASRVSSSSSNRDIRVRFNSLSKEYTFTLSSAIVEFEWNEANGSLNIKKYTGVNRENIEGKTFWAAFEKNTPDKFVGFYNYDYNLDSGCSKTNCYDENSDVPNHLKNGTCAEGWLPEYLYNPENSDFVKTFKRQFSEYYNVPEYNEIIELIRKLEPLGLIKSGETGGFGGVLNLQMILESLKAIDESLNNNLTLLNKVIQQGSRCGMLQSLWSLNRLVGGTAVYQSLALAERKLALKRLAEGFLTESNIDSHWCYFWLNGGEESVIKLLLTTPDGDKKAVLDYIYGTAASAALGGPQSVLSQFIRNIEGGNFDDLMLILTDWVYQHYPATESWDAIISRAEREKRNLLLLSKFANKVVIPKLAGGKTLFDFEVNGSASGALVARLGNVDALDYVVVKFDENFTVGGYTYTKGDVAAVPAMLAYLIKNDMKRQAAATGGKYVLYTGLTILTAGQIATATTTFEMTLAIVDMAVLGSDITMNEILATRLNQTPKGKQFLDYFNKFVLIYGGARVVTELSGILRDMRGAVNSIDDVEINGLFLQIETKVFLNDDFVKIIHNEVKNSNLPSLFPNLTIEELTAIRVFTSDRIRNGEKIYQALNNQLRNQNLEEFYAQLSNLMKGGFSKLPKFEGNVVYRGCGQLESNIARDWKLGDEIVFKEFKSTSTNIQVAGSFVDSGNGTVIYEIRNPLGYDICDISCIPGEAEILLLNNGKFEVASIQDNFVIIDTDFNVVTENGRKVTLNFLGYE